MHVIGACYRRLIDKWFPLGFWGLSSIRSLKKGDQCTQTRGKSSLNNRGLDTRVFGTSDILGVRNLYRLPVRVANPVLSSICGSTKRIQHTVLQPILVVLTRSYCLRCHAVTRGPTFRDCRLHAHGQEPFCHDYRLLSSSAASMEYQVRQKRFSIID